jgi:hypothetical protein
MHILNTNNNFTNVQKADFLTTKKTQKIYSICGNMDYFYV